MNGRRNLHAGPVYEKEIIDELNPHQLFPFLHRTAEIDPELDKKKCDISDKSKSFPYAIQAKNTTSKVVYPKILDQVSSNNPDKIPVILHKYNKNHNGRFLVQDRYAILKQKDFIELILDKERYEKGFREMLTYFDSISDEEQPKVHEFLLKLGL